MMELLSEINVIRTDQPSSIVVVIIIIVIIVVIREPQN